MTTNQKLIVELAKVHSASFAHLTYATEEKLPKYLGLGKVTKQVSTQCQMYYSYENAVNNRLEKQGDEAMFNAQSLPWGAWEIPNKVIKHKNALYLRYYGYKGAKCETTYYVDGAKATNEQLTIIKEYKAQKKHNSNTQSAVGLTDNQVTPKNVQFDNIISLVCGECQYHKD